MGKKTGLSVGGILIIIILIGVAFAAGYFAHDYFKASKGVTVDGGDGLHLPGETEVRVITVEQVEARLEEIAELNSYSGKYTVTVDEEATRHFLDDIKIPFTKNSMIITAGGIVKVGYDIAEINVEVSDSKIFISLPEAKVHDNYVIWDSVQCNEKNNIFNPIEFDQYKGLIAEIEKDGLEKVESEGIYAKAEENIKKIIEAFLSEFEGYEIVYM